MGQHYGCRVKFGDGLWGGSMACGIRVGGGSWGSDMTVGDDLEMGLWDSGVVQGQELEMGHASGAVSKAVGERLGIGHKVGAWPQQSSAHPSAQRCVPTAL